MPMTSRFWPRLWVFARALPPLLARSRVRPNDVRRILIAHHLLLGDTIMLAPLLKKLRGRYPAAGIVMLCNPAYVPLFEQKPYGVTALPYNPRSLASHRALAREAGFDLALIPGDNRWSWIARALGARWVVAFASDRRSYKDWPVDEFVRFPDEPEAWGDIATRLIDGVFDAEYEIGEWQAPRCSPYDLPSHPYCVLHLGASSPHKLWPTANWRALANWAVSRGFNIVLSSGKGEEELARELDPQRNFLHLAGALDLAQLWPLLANAAFVVCPDTGIAHLGRIVGTPTLALFGPGSPIVSGAGRFWGRSAFMPVWIEDIACRDQTLLFERDLPWVRHCWRSPQECGNPICIKSISFGDVLSALDQLGVK